MTVNATYFRNVLVNNLQLAYLLDQKRIVKYQWIFTLCIGVFWGWLPVLTSANPTPNQAGNSQLTAQAPGSLTLNYTGSPQTFTVPAGVTSLSVVAYGASGRGNRGGLGGKVSATMAVTQGTVLTILVGGTTNNTSGGYNGGGGGAYGGGGATDIRLGGMSLTNRVLVAGGGGGGSDLGSSGNGGGLIGADATGPSAPGGGGSQSAGGAGYNYGSLGQGGGNSGAGGGGGGGYYGGGGGVNYIGAAVGGGGGSSYTDPILCTNVIHTQGANTGNGRVELSWIEPAPPLSQPCLTGTPPNALLLGSGSLSCQTPTLSLTAVGGAYYSITGPMGGPTGVVSQSDGRESISLGSYIINRRLITTVGVAIVNKPGTYTVLVTGENGCTSTATILVTGTECTPLR